jgi:hypothetical protein
MKKITGKVTEFFKTRIEKEQARRKLMDKLRKLKMKDRKTRNEIQEFKDRNPKGR